MARIAQSVACLSLRSGVRKFDSPGPTSFTSQLLFFFFFLIQFNVPFKIISLIETSQSLYRWGETGVPRENHLTYPQGASRTWLVSHVASAGPEPTPDTAVR